MITFRPVGYDDPKYDNCGNTTHAILEIGTITIPLCNECINDLKCDLEKYNETVFCYMCEHFIQNKWGLSYDGSCKFMADINDFSIKEDDVGYAYPTCSMETCSFSKLKSQS